MSLSPQRFWLAALAVAFMVAPAIAADNPFAVPEGDNVKELTEFIVNLRKNAPEPPRSRPRTEEQKKAFVKFLQYRKLMPAAEKGAAEKLIELVKDHDSAAYGLATKILLRDRVLEMKGADAAKQKKVVDDIIASFKKYGIETADLALAAQSVAMLQSSGEEQVAAKACKTFAAMMKKADDSEVQGAARYFEGLARQFGFVGSQLTVLTGTTLEGKEFDWKSFSKNKVVLIDFWATWCGPCRAETPNVLKMYKKYHDRGFEVVGISLDRSEKPLKQYIESKKIPWTILFDKDPAKRSAMAQYYNVRGIPRLILVDRTGKVVSNNARGPILNKLLKKLIDDADVKKDGAKKKD